MGRGFSAVTTRPSIGPSPESSFRRSPILIAGARTQAIADFHVPTVADWRELLGTVESRQHLLAGNDPCRNHRGFLNSGAHVLVEKPIATTAGEAEHLIALARSRGLVLTVGHQERYVLARSGLFQITQTPAFVDCVREGPWTGRGTDVSVVLDLMIHDLDLVHSLIPGDIAEITAQGRSVYGQSFDEVTARLVFDSGATVRLTANRAAGQRKRSLRIGYADSSEIAFDFLTRELVNSTPTVLSLKDASDPLAEFDFRIRVVCQSWGASDRSARRGASCPGDRASDRGVACTVCAEQKTASSSPHSLTR